MLRGANPTPEPLSCPSACPGPSAGLAAGPWFLTAAPHSPFVPSHPQHWAVPGFEDTAAVTPQWFPGVTHTLRGSRERFVQCSSCSPGCAVGSADTPCNLSLAQVRDLLMSCLFVCTVPASSLCPPQPRAPCASLAPQQGKGAVCKWASSPGVLQIYQQCVNQNAFLIMSWKQFFCCFKRNKRLQFALLF